MKKVVLILVMIFGIGQVSHAQLDFGIKGGVNYSNTGDLSSSAENLVEGADASSGYHAGIWFRIKFLGLYVRPEIIYTDINSEYEANGIVADYGFSKVDVPVLLGTKILGFGTIFIGPSFQYIIEDGLTLDDISTDDFDKFSLGMQLGFGVEFGRFGLDVRWERGLSSSEADFVGDNIGNFNIDNRTNQIIFGASIRLF
jgi:hypothetical protein